MELKDKLLAIEKEQAGVYIGSLKHVPRLLNIGALTGWPVFIQGDPGTGKSSIIRSYFSAFRDLSQFVLSGSRFADKTDLIGYRSLKAYKENDEMVYNVEGTMVTSDLIFLDECLEISEKINKLLYPIMYEREFQNGRERRIADWLMFIGGTNKKFSELSESSGFIDRFILRTFIPNITDADELIKIRQKNRQRRKAGEKYHVIKSINVSREELMQARKDVLDIEIPDIIDDAISNIFIKLNTQGKILSTRRWTDLDLVLQAVSYLNGSTKVTLDSLEILSYVLASSPADLDLIAKTLQMAAFNPIIQLTDLEKKAEDLYSSCKGKSVSDAAQAGIISQAMSELSDIRDKTNEIVSKARQNNCYTSKLQDLVNKIIDIHTMFAAAITLGKPLSGKK